MSQLECLTADGITEAAKEARREYHREWQKRNRDKVKQYHDKYWNKKAEQIQAEKEKAADNSGK